MTTQLHNGPIEAEQFDGTLNNYQHHATSTAVYPGQGCFWGLCYVSLKGSGEAGEFNEKVGKLLRDDGLKHDSTPIDIPVEKRDALILEIGDELWYVAAKCNELGITLEQAARANLEKLASRQERGKLAGSGDFR
jgi:NTP pyrophosphatase (non-canonical NTP hydrolase)